MLNEELLGIIFNRLEIPYPDGEAEGFFEKYAPADLKFSADYYSDLITMREYLAGFSNRLLHSFSKPIQEFEILIEVCRGLGHRTQALLESNSDDESFRMRALRRLYQKATLLTAEIVHLIKGGFAAGALTRWRTLLEVSVISVFLATRDDEVSEMYLEHAHIERRKELSSYVAYSEPLGFESISKEVQDEVEAKAALAIERFGREFSAPFGWASKNLQQKRVNLHDLLKIANLEKIKPFYNHANNYVHGGPKSLLYNIGFINGVSGDQTIAAPSNLGFTDPVQLCSLSYFHVCTAYFSLAPSIAGLADLLLVYSKIPEVAASFSRVEQEIEAQELGETLSP